MLLTSILNCEVWSPFASAVQLGLKSLKLAPCSFPSLVILHPRKGKGEGKGPILVKSLLHDEHMVRSTLQSRKWQLIGMS